MIGVAALTAVLRRASQYSLDAACDHRGPARASHDTTASVTALCTVFAYFPGALLRRGWTPIVCGLLLTAIPYVVATNPLLPDEVDRWILRLTPAAAFAVQQTGVEYAQVVAHFAPSNGYFPLPAWAGLAVLGAYLVVAWWAAVVRRPAR
ncbi:hypothetical protein [Promicromonospora sp. NPDC023805]|uniref:hypothetical protein n=1 Tax=Promicromonospora sp. NPDC023805 TaxID=3154696 RepID=UPI0033EC904F